MSCGIYYDVPIAIKGPKGNPHAHPEITNRVSDIEIACWVAKGAKATVRAALTGAGYSILRESENKIVLKQLPIYTPEEELIEELRKLVKALLPIIKR